MESAASPLSAAALRYDSRPSNYDFPQSYTPSIFQTPSCWCARTNSPLSNCRSHSAQRHDFSSHQFPESKYGPRCVMIFPDISALVRCAGVESSCKTDAEIAGRKRRSAAVASAVLSVWEVFPLGTSSFARATADEADTTAHENGCMRNASSRCVSSRTGVPIRSLPRRALKRASVSES